MRHGQGRDVEAGRRGGFGRHDRQDAGRVDSGGSLAQGATDEPLYGRQWHLDSPSGNDINIEAVWADYDGTGITVAVIDTGIDLDHPDLDGNIDPANQMNSRTGATGAGQGAPRNAGDNHGTAVAGVIAAEDNGIGVVGVAFGATLVPIYTPLTTSAFARHGLEYAQNFDVVNNSWGYGGEGDPFYVNFADTVTRSGEDASFSAYGTAIRNTAEGGRDGLGTIIVFSAGNHHDSGDDTNLSNFTNTRYAITVGATQEDGTAAAFSTRGASILISAPGVGIATTDRDGNQGYVPNIISNTLGSNDYVEMDGTSFSAPIISAVSALLLQANPGLGARDVQEILAYSARTIDSGSASWQTNGSSNWNGGGLTWSYDYGTGLVDARAAVRLAETWFMEDLFGLEPDPAHTFNNETTATGTRTGNFAIPDNDANGISNTLAITTDILIDHIEVLLKVTHTWIGDLLVELISPAGTVAPLVVLPYLGSASENNINATLSSTFFWGEHSAGTWTLRVADLGPGDTGALTSWRLTAYGDAIDGDDTYYYTNEYGAAFQEADGARRTLSDGAGNDTINLAAVTSGSSINLTANDGTVAGRNFVIAPGAIIENVIGGDGDDAFTGNGGVNLLFGGRGADTLSGMGGNDRLAGGSGDDRLLGGAGDDTLAGAAGDDVLSGGTGRDTVDYSAAAGGIRVNLQKKFAQEVGVGEGNDTLSGVEDAVGSPFDDHISGTKGVNTLLGGDGNDRLLGGGSDDLLLGGGGDDILNGGHGDDRLVGGTGADRLTGGSGADEFRFATGDGADIITDFVASAGAGEYIRLAVAGFDEFADILAAADDGGGTTHVRIDFGGGDSLTLLGARIDDLFANDFVFT